MAQAVGSATLLGGNQEPQFQEPPEPRESGTALAIWHGGELNKDHATYVRQVTSHWFRLANTQMTDNVTLRSIIQKDMQRIRRLNNNTSSSE